MEIRLEAVSGSGGTPQPGCFTSVKLGDVLKQGRYDDQRWYQFPSGDRHRTAKIEVYQHIGSATLSISPEKQFAQEVEVISSDSRIPNMTMKVDVRLAASKDAVAEREARQKETLAAKNEAKEYMNLHGIHEKLAVAVRALLKEQPPSPIEFLWKYLQRSDRETTSSQVAGGSVAAHADSQSVDICRDAIFEACAAGRLSSAIAEVRRERCCTEAEPTKSQDMNALRDLACSRLLEACEGGTLAQILTELKNDDTFSTFRPRPSVYLQREMRMRAGEVLLAAADDGRLEAALQSATPQPVRSPAQSSGTKDLLQLRQEASEKLLSSVDSGLLDNALSDMVKEQSSKGDSQAQMDEEAEDALRKIAFNKIVDATFNGDLFRALEELKKDSDDPSCLSPRTRDYFDDTTFHELSSWNILM